MSVVVKKKTDRQTDKEVNAITSRVREREP